MRSGIIRDITERTGLLSPSEWGLLVALALRSPSSAEVAAALAPQFKLSSTSAEAILQGLAARGFVARGDGGVWLPTHPPLRRLLERQTENFLQLYVHGLEGGLLAVRHYLDESFRSPAS